MSRSEQIRDWLKAHGPATMAQIAAALNLTPRQAKAGVCDQVARGWLVIAGGEIGNRAYAVGKPPSQRDREARAARVLATENAARDKRDTARQVIAMRTSALASAPMAGDLPCTETFILTHGHDPARYQVLKPGEGVAPLRFEY